MGAGGWPLVDGANPSVYYRSHTIASEGQRVIATDAFQFTLTDTAGAESGAGTVSVTIPVGFVLEYKLTERT